VRFLLSSRLSTQVGLLSAGGALGASLLTFVLAHADPGSARGWAGVALGTSLAFIAGQAQGKRWDQKLGRLNAQTNVLMERKRARTFEDDFEALADALSELAVQLEGKGKQLRSEQVVSNLVFSGMQEGILLLDHERRVTVMNPALREMLLLRSDAAGTPFIEVVRHAKLNELLASVNHQQAASAEIEIGGVKPRHLLVRASRLSSDETRSKTNAPDSGAFLAVFVDVTDLRRLESLRRDFVANVSHELRTPVTALVSATETLRGALAKNPEAALRFIDIIERNADRLRRLIEDILDLSRVESREFKFRKEQVRLKPFFEHIETLFHERAEKRAMHFKLEIADDAKLEIDRHALEQVIANLVENAVKYANASGTIVLRVTQTLDGATRLDVADDGPGIAAKHLARLFERFYRVDEGRTREQGGTGLGLAIAKHLTEAMGGSLGVESEAGKGTCFFATFKSG
jgi:two-component system, OmpR family, phosphate regulon sensor histidine kinase PhoR